MDIISKIKKAKLAGRGGGCFSVFEKWSAMKKSVGDKRGKSYVICNAAEGEPGVKKDGYIIKNFGEEVINGIRIALDYFKSEKAYLYINSEYYKLYSKELKSYIDNSPIEFFIKPKQAGYIGGEESAIINAIEGKKIEPKKKPPFLTSKGLWGYPTLTNNVETFLNISLVNEGKFEEKRFYTIGGDCGNPGVFCFNEKMKISDILKATENYPDFSFFIQAGGDMSGQILNSAQINCACPGAGSITIYNSNKHDPRALFKKWINFFREESCGKCTPCREGTYRIFEELNKSEVNWQLIADLFTNLEESAFCGLGCAAPIAIKSYLFNVAFKYESEKIIEIKKASCKCFR